MRGCVRLTNEFPVTLFECVLMDVSPVRYVGQAHPVNNSAEHMFVRKMN